MYNEKIHIPKLDSHNWEPFQSHGVLVFNLHMHINIPLILYMFYSLDERRSSPVTAEDTESESDPRTRHGQRIVLQKLLTSTLTHLCRHSSAVECLLRFNDLSLLFGAISSPCPPHNKIWRKAAAECLLAIFRYTYMHMMVNQLCNVYIVTVYCYHV